MLSNLYVESFFFLVIWMNFGFDIWIFFRVWKAFGDRDFSCTLVLFSDGDLTKIDLLLLKFRDDSADIMRNNLFLKSVFFFFLAIWMNLPFRSVNVWWSLVFFQSNSFVEGVSHKIRRQIEELERVSGVESSSLTVDGVPVDSYLTRWITFCSVRSNWHVMLCFWNSTNGFLGSESLVFCFSGLSGMKPSIRPCLLWGRLWMEFTAKWQKLRMILR